jgi:hypothetical protein
MLKMRIRVLVKDKHKTFCSNLCFDTEVQTMPRMGETISLLPKENKTAIISKVIYTPGMYETEKTTELTRPNGNVVAELIVILDD